MKLGIPIKEIMTRKIVTIDENKTVQQTAKRMAEYRVGSIIVLRKDRPIGIITETDMNKRVVAKAKDPKKLKAKHIMSSPITFVNPDDDVSDAVEKMKKYKIRRFPVLKNGKIIGIVTHTDVARVSPEMMDILNFRLKMRAGTPSVLSGSTSGICDICGNYSDDLQFENDQWTCEVCRESRV